MSSGGCKSLTYEMEREGKKLRIACECGIDVEKREDEAGKIAAQNEDPESRMQHTAMNAWC